MKVDDQMPPNFCSGKVNSKTISLDAFNDPLIGSCACTDCAVNQDSAANQSRARTAILLNASIYSPFR